MSRLWHLDTGVEMSNESCESRSGDLFPKRITKIELTMLNMITVKLGRPSTRGMGTISGWVGLFFSDLELINKQMAK